MPAPIFQTADALIRELGITEPEELDVLAMAQYCCATVLYKPLNGCAARIVGDENRAIITIDSNSRPERQRFSAGHELGHWMFDRGQLALFSCEESVFVKEWLRNNPEARANRYAADLLMPVWMFKPKMAQMKAVDFDAVKQLSKVFVTSLTATAMRVVEHGSLPAMLICSSDKGIEWCTRGEGTKALWPKTPGANTFAYDVLQGTETDVAGDVLASAWFDHWIAGDYEVHEHSVRAFDHTVLTLIWWRNESMLIHLDEHEERQESRRSDWRS